MTGTAPTGKFLLGALCSSIAVAILVIAMLAVFTKKPAQMQVFLGGEEIAVAVADTPALRAQGLGEHEELAPNEGMLFVFPEPALSGFWMKDMRFPIDIIYFDADRRIVDVWERATPESYPKVFTPRVPTQFVLEVPAGFFADHHLKLGNTIEIPR